MVCLSNNLTTPDPSCLTSKFETFIFLQGVVFNEKIMTAEEYRKIIRYQALIARLRKRFGETAIIETKYLK